MGFVHVPVMLSEVLELAGSVAPRRIVDCTVGGAGHASALLDAYPEATLLGIDRDPEARAAASARLERFGARAQVIAGRFSEVAELVATHVGQAVDLLLADVGVSSHQLDSSVRGFSFRARGPLDMRMDPTHGESARELIARLSADELTTIVRELGEERFAGRVARALTAERPTTTEALAALVRRHVPMGRDGLDPATRTFQALRIAVNDELGELTALLAALPGLLAHGGVAIVISFHSLEDRLVKHAFRDAAKGCICPRELPVCRCEHKPSLEILTSRPRCPSEAECQANPRAASAKLRAARRIGSA